MARDPDAIIQEKKALRAAVRRRLDAVGSRRSAAGISATKILTHLAEWNNATEFLLFVGMKSEIATEPLIEAAFTSGKPVRLPQISGKIMRFYAVSEDHWRENRLVRHSYGMLEPRPEWPPWSPSSSGITLIICPGMAFDKTGNRLGHGGGFYDRFLATLSHRQNEAPQPAGPADGEAQSEFTIVGLCYDFQLVEAVPTGPDDIRVDGVVTEKQVVWANPDMALET